jgi:hypothetical protein
MISWLVDYASIMHYYIDIQQAYTIVHASSQVN